MIWFTLGNISVEGTYYTHALNLTPRGVLFGPAPSALPYRGPSAVCRTVRRSRGVGSPSGTGDPRTNCIALINKPLNPRTQGHAIRPRPKRSTASRPRLSQGLTPYGLASYLPRLPLLLIYRAKGYGQAFTLPRPSDPPWIWPRSLTSIAMKHVPRFGPFDVFPIR